MKRIGFQRTVYQLDFDLQVNFNFQSAHIYSVSQKKYEKMFPQESDPSFMEGQTLFGVDIPKRKKHESQFGYIIIDVSYEIPAYDSLNQGSAVIRHQIIAILGIMSFLTNYAFIPAMSFQSSMCTVPNHIIKQEKALAFHDGIDLSKDLQKILSAIRLANEERRVLIYTLFERWRKALYLESESDESEIFIDESVLAYMHVLEVLADEFKGELTLEINNQRKKITNDIIKLIQTNNFRPKEINKLTSLLENTRVSLKTKIFQLLISFDLDTLKTRRIVERFIEHRNAIAHGRKNLFQEKLIFPLPQFFSFIKDVDEDVELIKVLAAVSISKLLDLDIWKDEWLYKLQYEMLPFELVEDFIKREKYLTYNSEDFFSNEDGKVNPYFLAFYYKKGKLSLLNLETVLKDPIVKCKRQKINYQILFEAAVILSDSKLTVLAKKCKNIVQTVYKNEWCYHSNIRDVIKDYEYHGKKLAWFEQWLIGDKN
jgi:hypothetical protein